MNATSSTVGRCVCVRQAKAAWLTILRLYPCFCSGHSTDLEKSDPNGKKKDEKENDGLWKAFMSGLFASMFAPIVFMLAPCFCNLCKKGGDDAVVAPPQEAAPSRMQMMQQQQQLVQQSSRRVVEESSRNLAAGYYVPSSQVSYVLLSWQLELYR